MMDVASAIAVASSGGALSALALKSPEFLKEIYGDLAKPGVTQVGKAIGGLLGLGNTILFPLHLLNERARLALEANFERYREKLAQQPPEKIIEPAPEIAVPILEAFPRVEDETLQEMFAELLAKASHIDNCEQVHPVLVKIVGEITPDEAEFIRQLHRFKMMILNESMLRADIRAQKEDQSYKVLDEHVYVPFGGPFLPKGFKDNGDFLIENLIRVGLFERENRAYPKRDAPDRPRLEKQLTEMFSPKLAEGEKLEILWGALRVTQIGESFARATLPSGTSEAALSRSSPPTTL